MIHPHLRVLTLSGVSERGCSGLGRSFTFPVWWTRCSRRITVDTLQPNVAACNVLFGSTRHEHPKCSVSFIFWEPWHDHTETYPTSTKLFLYNSNLPMTWSKEKVENLRLSCSTWLTCNFTKSLFASVLYLLCRNYQWICKHKQSTRVILNFEASAIFNKRVIHIWNVCVFKCTSQAYVGFNRYFDF